MPGSKWRGAEKWGVALAVVTLGWAIFIWLKPTPAPTGTPTPAAVGNIVQGPGGIIQIGAGNQVATTPSKSASQPQESPSQPNPQPEAKPTAPAPAPESVSETLHVEAEQSAPAFNGEIMVSVVGLTFEGEPLRHRVSFTLNDIKGGLSKTYQKQDVGAMVRSGDFSILVKSADTFSATFEIRKQPRLATASGHIQSAPNRVGSATTTGPNSPAVTGGTNTFNYGTDRPKPEDKP